MRALVPSSSEASSVFAPSKSVSRSASDAVLASMASPMRLSSSSRSLIARRLTSISRSRLGFAGVCWALCRVATGSGESLNALLQLVGLRGFERHGLLELCPLLGEQGFEGGDAVAQLLQALWDLFELGVDIRAESSIFASLARATISSRTHRPPSSSPA